LNDNSIFKKIFNAANLDLITYYQETIQIITPNPGWVEQDPNEILNKTILCIEKATEQLHELGYNKSNIKGTNKKRMKFENFSFSYWCNKST